MTLKKRRHVQPGNKELPNHRLRRGALIALIVVGGGIAWGKLSPKSGWDEEEDLFTVPRGDLRISVLEPGKIQAHRSVTIASEVEGETTILSIVREGSHVEKGDVLVELDSALHREEIVKHEILVKAAEARYINTLEAYEIQKNQNESDVKAAELARDFAEIDLRKYAGDAAYAKAHEAYEERRTAGGNGDAQELAQCFSALKIADYTDGDWCQRIIKADNDVTTSQTALRLSESSLSGTERLRGMDYVTQTELEAEKFAHEKAKIALEQAEEGRRLLIEYDHPKQLTKLVADYQEAEKKLERARRKAKSQLAQRESELNASDVTHRIEKARLERHEAQLGKTLITAPQQGLVVYSSSSEDHHHMERGLIAEGEKVWEGQELIELPDLSTMKVKVHIHEPLREVVKPGQEAVITVEALPGQVFSGHLETIGILPDFGHGWLEPDLTVYISYVIVDSKSDALMPGMTATVKIILADLKDVLYVPVEAVTFRGEQVVCVLARQGKKIAVPIEVGQANDEFVEIKSGLKEGDRVLAHVTMALAAEADVSKSGSARTQGRGQ